MDVHVPQPITEQLRLRGVDVLTAWDDERQETPDDLLLNRATTLNRVLVTFDQGFRMMAEEWQAQGRYFAGLIFCRTNAASYGKYIDDLQYITEVSDSDELKNTILRLPL